MTNSRAFSSRARGYCQGGFVPLPYTPTLAFFFSPGRSRSFAKSIRAAVPMLSIKRFHQLLLHDFNNGERNVGKIRKCVGEIRNV